MPKSKKWPKTALERSFTNNFLRRLQRHAKHIACHFTETCSTCHEDGTTSSKRLETKKLIAALKKENPYIEANIFKSVENVNLSTIIAYKKDGVKHHFLDEYKKPNNN